MKIKADFITNSSSTSFSIMNLTNEARCLVTFVKENPELIRLYITEYSWEMKDEYNQESLIQSARENNIYWKPKEKKFCIFGDEDGTLIGKVFDYMLRDGGKSKSFKWKFEEYLR